MNTLNQFSERVAKSVAVGRMTPSSFEEFRQIAKDIPGTLREPPHVLIRNFDTSLAIFNKFVSRKVVYTTTGGDFIINKLGSLTLTYMVPYSGAFVDVKSRDALDSKSYETKADFLNRVNFWQRVNLEEFMLAIVDERFMLPVNLALENVMERTDAWVTKASDCLMRNSIQYDFEFVNSL